MIPHEPGAPPTSPAEPLLKVTGGNPTAEELAAITAVVLALQSDSSNEDSPTPTRHWVRRDRLNLPPKPGAGSWRRSGR